jgi:hypothetical protein
MFLLKPPRHISTLPFASVWLRADRFRSTPINGQFLSRSGCLKGPGAAIEHADSSSAYTRLKGIGLCLPLGRTLGSHVL